MSAKLVTRPREPKPCPRCYAPMKPGPDGLACEKHGAPPEPKREQLPVRHQSTPRVPRAKKEKAAPKVRGPRKTIRYPSDLKSYPLPPSPDGRSTGFTSKESPTTARSRLTPELVAYAIEQVRLRGSTPWQIAGDIWEKAGYSSRDACKGSLYRALYNAGVISVTSATSAPHQGPTPE